MVIRITNLLDRLFATARGGKHSGKTLNSFTVERCPFSKL
jgi:hypothetical protein